VHNASGHHRDENRWPLLPLAAPRGAREWFWHLGVAVAVVTALVPPGGILVLALAFAMTWVLDAQSKQLFRVGLEFMATGLVVAMIFVSLGAFPATVVHTFTWSRAHQVGMPLAFIIGYFIELSVSIFAVATLRAFDRRTVNRATVDLRVWQRQQARRRQLLRHWHERWDIPEVSQ
jgi:fumarate reductase subunit D